MNELKIQILETLVTLFLYAIAFYITKNIIDNTLKKAQLHRARRKMIIKVTHLFISIAVVVLLAGIWGLEQKEIAVFASTILTVLGIAFFAQWSLLSNITSSLILFFTHPMRLGDTIKILDKDYPMEGEVAELTYFFVHLKTKDGETITVPNSLIFQKSVSIIVNQDKKMFEKALPNKLISTDIKENSAN
ncbi:mechanosensitive ion channel family protein [Pontibacter diazotrophicus]|uniref:Mechanosensitive ion channel family protein n=1 Tax=Pontibacter diazotrophicus TaxID=1400979 RepID=A0A3D8L010_9BACT|nr:mechanosensitive ion channel domain-containing protein [Pontibacter diazotrophicus]RDV10716.1 mechanosensitive ion channel family protein [Pontibacter diazotrophicus]